MEPHVCFHLKSDTNLFHVIVMDSDRVLVLDDGRVAEFDSPEALLQKKDGIFKSMVEKSRESNEK